MVTYFPSRSLSLTGLTSSRGEISEIIRVVPDRNPIHGYLGDILVRELRGASCVYCRLW